MKKISMIAGLMLSVGMLSAEVRVSGADAIKAAVSKVQPEYTPIARQMKVAGSVEIEAVVDASGKVESAKAVSGNPILTQSSVNAVQKWRFTPFTENGQPTKAVATLKFDFRP